MQSREHHPAARNIPSSANLGNTHDLAEARRLHKSSHPIPGRFQRDTIQKEISILEFTWQQIKSSKNSAGMMPDVPRTKICLTRPNMATPIANPNHKTIMISTTNYPSKPETPNIPALSPTKTPPSKWKKNVNPTPKSDSQSPIKKYLRRFREVNSEAEAPTLNCTWEIEDILLMHR